MNKRNIALMLVFLLSCLTILGGCQEDNKNESAKENTSDIILQEFSKISEIPRGSQGTLTQIQEYIIKRASEMDIPSTVDKTGNVILEKPATKGFEKKPTTILQTNMDMVTKADKSVLFEVNIDPITPIVNNENGLVTGNNTSLGASSGIGIATTMFVLENSINHGKIRAVFTVYGETDMSGAKNLEKKYLEGDYLINLNNNRNTSIETGSAYTSVLECVKEIKYTKTENKYSYILVADGFKGGNAGEGAVTDQGNPVKFLAEILALAKGEGLVFQLNDITAGDNVYDIPKQATATISVNDYEKGKIGSVFNNVQKKYTKEYAETEPDIKLNIIETTVPDKSLSYTDSDNLISFLYGLNDGSYNENSGINASSNLGNIKFNDKDINIQIYTQARTKELISVMAQEQKAIAKISDINLKEKSKSIGFTVDKDAYLPANLQNSYRAINISTEQEYKPIRTEMGYFKEKSPDLQMVAIGPTIDNENTTNETLKLNTIDDPAAAILAFFSEMNTVQN